MASRSSSASAHLGAYKMHRDELCVPPGTFGIWPLGATDPRDPPLVCFLEDRIRKRTCTFIHLSTGTWAWLALWPCGGAGAPAPPRLQRSLAGKTGNTTLLCTTLGQALHVPWLVDAFGSLLRGGPVTNSSSQMSGGSASSAGSWQLENLGMLEPGSGPSG